MKTKLLLVFTLALSMSVFVGCEKNDIVGSRSDNENFLLGKALPDGDLQVIFTNGHILIVINGGDLQPWGYYMREFYPAGSVVANTYGRGKGGCYGQEGSCGPDTDIIAGKLPVEIDIDSDPSNNLYVEISKECAQNINNSYTIPLRKALKDGDNAVKEFFFNNMLMNTEFPDDLVNDFKAGKITMKEFPEGIFIVNKGAEKYNDSPQYKW